MSEIACPSCGQERETVQGDYQYRESGLDNVWICGIEIFHCPCGESSALIPNILELHQTIAKCLLQQKRRLTGKEIRFLRKRMAMKGKDFAKLAGVDNATVSRWENEKEAPSDPADRFIRLFYAIRMELHREAEELIKNIFPEIKPGQPTIPIHVMADRMGHLSCSSECR
ncbi:MAG: helix-turn-helix domain-containing protein [Deltaproteobacteria bacterium]|nr:helix-turn-helix domain-containing protein [Deltaproteobacteria bacterium]